jgi:hypothetical protein
VKRTLIEIVVVGVLVGALLYLWMRGPAPDAAPVALGAATPAPPTSSSSPNDPARAPPASTRTSVGAAADVAQKVAEGLERARDVGDAGPERMPAVQRKWDAIYGTVPPVPADAPPPSLSKDDIQKAIRAATPKIRGCYESALRVQPQLAGRVVVLFHIEGDTDDDTKGTVTSGEIADSDLQSPFFEACVLKEVAGVEFDAPKGGGSVTVRYPFHFANDNDAGP